jgi:hypothetical protein
LLAIALSILAIASVLRPTNWIVAVPLVLVGLARERPARVTLATLGAALGVPFFWMLWRYISAPIPGLAIEWTPATSNGAVAMIAAYVHEQLQNNVEIFALAPFFAAPFYQHVMFESVAVVLLCIPLAAVAARRHAPASTSAFKSDVFNLLALGLALVAFLGFYFDSQASISRVMAPFLLMALLVMVATRAHAWLVAGAIAAHLLVAPSFLATYREWRVDLFRNDRTKYEQFRAQVAPVLMFNRQRTAWCNTLLTTTYEREIIAVPAGVGLSVGRPAGKLVPPIKSGYVLLTADSVTDFGDKAPLQHLATTVLGELYANRDAACTVR